MTKSNSVILLMISLCLIWFACSRDDPVSPVIGKDDDSTSAFGYIEGVVTLDGEPIGGVEVFPLPQGVETLSKTKKSEKANGGSTGYYILKLYPGAYTIYFQFAIVSSSGSITGYYSVERDAEVTAGDTLTLDVELFDDMIELYKPASVGRYVSLDWPGVSGADYYRVYRSTDSLSWEFLTQNGIYTTTSSNYVDTVDAYGTYFYKISYMDGGGEKGFSDVESIEVSRKPPDITSVFIRDSIDYIFIMTTVPNPDETDFSLVIFHSLDSNTGYSVLDTVADSLYISSYPVANNLSIFEYRDSTKGPGRYYYRFIVLDNDSGLAGDTSKPFSINYTKQVDLPYITLTDSMFYIRLRMDFSGIYSLMHPLAITVYRSLKDSLHFSPIDTVIKSSTASSYVYYRDYGVDTGKIYYAVSYKTADNKQSGRSKAYYVIHDTRIGAPYSFYASDSGVYVRLRVSTSTYTNPVVLFRISGSDTLALDTITCPSSGSYCYYNDTPDSEGVYIYFAAHLGIDGIIGRYSTMRTVDFQNRLKAPSLTAYNHGRYVSLTIGSVMGADKYYVYRATTTLPDDLGRHVTLLDVPGTVTDTPAVPGDYYYKVFATPIEGKMGQVAMSQGIHFTGRLPAPEISLTVYDIYLRLRIYRVTGAFRYIIKRSFSGPDNMVAVDTVAASSSSSQYYYDTLAQAGFYCYTACALDSGYEEGDAPQPTCAYFAATLAPPNPPTLMDRDTAIYVDYSASSYDTILIYRATAQNGPYTLVTKRNPGLSTYYRDNTVSTSGYYFYKLKRKRGKLESDFSQVAYIYFTYQLPPPSNVYGSRYSGYIRVQWYPVSGVLSYNIYRRTSSQSTYTKIGEVTKDYLSYNDNTVTSGNTYYYKVSSVGPSGESSLSSDYYSVTYY